MRTGCAEGGLDMAAGKDSPFEMIDDPTFTGICPNGLQPIS